MVISAFHSGWDVDLTELLDRQAALHAQLRGVSEQQVRIVASGDPDPAGLARLSARRKNLVDQLTRLTQRLEVYRRTWPTVWPSLDGGVRRRLESMIDWAQRSVEASLRTDRGASA